MTLDVYFQPNLRCRNCLRQHSLTAFYATTVGLCVYILATAVETSAQQRTATNPNTTTQATVTQMDPSFRSSCDLWKVTRTGKSIAANASG